MSEQLPAPLVPTNVDLQSFPGFILDVDRLLSSELVAVGSPEECWAAVMLWCKSWKQSPPSSLPDDDKVLAAFSGAGRRWRKVKNMALRGFVKCSDGRLYHKVLAQEANSAWERRIKFSARGAKGNKTRWEKSAKDIHKGSQEESLSDPSRIAQEKEERVLKRSLDDPYSSQEKRSEVKDNTDSSALLHSDGISPDTPESESARSQQEHLRTTPTTRLAIELRRMGVAITSSHPALGEWLAKVTHAQVLDAVAIARVRKPDGQIPALYLSPIINDLSIGVGNHETRRGSHGSTGAEIMSHGFAQLNGQH